MRKWLNFYFDLSKREFNGLLMLACLILLIAAIPHGYRLLNGRHDEEGVSLEAVAGLLEEHHKEIPRPTKKTWFLTDKKAQPVLFFFDPNTASAADWKKLGLSDRQSAAVLKYISKGGRFRKKEDLRKMYTISTAVYGNIAPFVRIRPDTNGVQRGLSWENKVKPAAEAVLPVIEINGADSAKLCEIRGIGPAFAQRIVRYRERIGGFHQKEQLMEVFGLDSGKYAGIGSQVRVDLARLKKININTATKEDFKNHPYLRYKQVNALIEYRKQHGNYSNIADLNKVLILDPITISRIGPYLTF